MLIWLFLWHSICIFKVKLTRSMKKQILRFGLKKWPIIATLMCAATMTVQAQTTGAVSVPDLTPGLVIENLSFPVAGLTRDFLVKVYETNNVTAGNPITVLLSKISGFTITYSTTSGISNVFTNTPNENSNWIFTENDNFVIATAKPGVTIPAGQSAKLGFSISRKPGIITGTYQTLTTIIVGGSGGETNSTNNYQMTSFTASAN